MENDQSKVKMPTDEQRVFLNQAYNFFYDIVDEMAPDSFWVKAPY